MSHSPPESPRLLYCRCAYAQVLPQEVKDGVLQGLCRDGLAFESVADLCEMAARRDPRLAGLAGGEENRPLRIAACHPRAVRWLFHAAGAALPAQAEVVNLRTLTAAEALAQLRAPAGTAAPEAPDADTLSRKTGAGSSGGEMVPDGFSLPVPGASAPAPAA